MSGNYFCHVCGGLVDLIKLQPSDVRLCECENRFARLHAENERLKAELAEAVIAGDRALIAGLRSELTEAKKDAERYRWLRSTDTGPSAIWELVNDDDYSPPCLTLKCGEFLDAAIDEAMKGK